MWLRGEMEAGFDVHRHVYFSQTLADLLHICDTLWRQRLRSTGWSLCSLGHERRRGKQGCPFAARNVTQNRRCAGQESATRCHAHIIGGWSTLTR
jgi:hypothetical protein